METVTFAPLGWTGHNVVETAEIAFQHAQPGSTERCKALQPGRGKGGFDDRVAVGEGVGSTVRAERAYAHRWALCSGSPVQINPGIEMPV